MVGYESLYYKTKWITLTEYITVYTMDDGGNWTSAGLSGDGDISV